jgi:predicted ATPase
MFDKTSNKIELNPNLVTIIGGRGEGKSMLTEYISTSFYDKEKTKDGDFSKKGNIEVEYCKTIRNNGEKLNFLINEEKHSVDFIYISQGDLKNQVEDREKKSKLATSISNLAKLKKSKFSEELNEKILGGVDELHKLKEFLDQKENSIAYLENEEKSVNEFINNITTEENKEKLQQYSKNLVELNNLSTKKGQLTRLSVQLNDNIIQLNLNIKNVNGELTKIPELSLAEFAYKEQIIAINLWLSEIAENVIKIETEITKVKSEFEEFYKGDLTTLLNDVDKFQNSLFEIRKKLAETKNKETNFDNTKKQMFIDTEETQSFVTKIYEEYKKQQAKIFADWNSFSKVDERQDLNPQQKEIMKNLLNDLDIEVIIDFDEEKFYNEIHHCINGAEWRVKNDRQKQKEHFKINDINSFFNYMQNKYIYEYYNTGLHRKNFTSVLFDENKRKNYIKVFPILKYQGKDLNKISVGQKGTVYLKMMLATEAFSKPIIFDQPEDDLDNEFIMSNLIDLFKDLKKYRQVIIVTHNANLVINADAEQIIIANNDKGKLKYISGSLENENINNKICEILEGGKIAFEKRRNKYKYVR